MGNHRVSYSCSDGNDRGVLVLGLFLVTLWAVTEQPA